MEAKRGDRPDDRREEFRRPVRAALRQLFGDSLVYGVGRVAGYIVGLVLLPLYTHYLSVEQYGLLESLFVLAILLGAFVPLGLTDALQRFWFLARNELDRARIVGSAFSGVLLMLLFWVPLLLVLSPEIVSSLLGDESSVAAFQLAVVTLVPACLLSLAFAMLKARFRSWQFGICSVVQVFLVGAVNVYLVAGLGLGIVGIFLGGAIAATATATLALFFVRADVSFRVSAARLKEMLAYSAPMVPAFISFWALSYADRWLLFRMDGLTQVGLYSAGAKIAGVLLFVNFAANTAFGPVSMRLAERPEAKSFYARALTGYCCVAATIAVGLTAIAREFLTLLTPAEYLEGYRAVSWLTLGFVFAGSATFVSVGVHVVKRTRHMTWIAIVSAAANVFLNLLLIPELRMVGAAIATTCSYALMSFLFYLVNQRLFPVAWELSRLARLLVLLLAALAALRALDGSGFASIAARSGVAILFPVLLFVSRTITPADIRGFVRSID